MKKLKNNSKKRFQNLKNAVVHCAGNLDFWLLFKLNEARLFAFAILRCCKSSKKVFNQANRALEIKTDLQT